MKDMVQKLRARLALISALMLAPVAGLAGTPLVYTDGPTPVFELEVPNFWTVRTGGLRALTEPGSGAVRDVSRVIGMVPEEHPGIWVGFVSPHGVRTLQEGRSYLQEIGRFLVTDPIIVSDTRRLVAGLPAHRITGTGSRNNKALTFTALIIDMPNGRVAVSVVILEAGADHGPVNDINAMMSSFRAIR